MLRTLLACLFGVGISAAPAAAEVKIVLPRNRTAYQTNEWIDLSVSRSGDKPLSASELELRLIGADGSKLTFTLPATRRVEHLHVNGWLLRPGKYTVEVSCDGATERTDIEVFSHIRRSTFRLVNWGARAQKTARLPEGEDNLGYNLFNGGQNDESLIRAGCDFMANCVMSGGHQMDLRQECDWSDPLVLQGGTRRVVRQAFRDRIWPNTLGVHFYDEPGLTWHTDLETKQNTPHGIPSQVRAFEATFGRPLLDYKKLDPKDPKQAERWRQWARWKLGFMDAAWKDAKFGVRSVRPDYVTVTQSQYGYSAFTDGYYFNVVRSLPIISGHGGYHDFGPGYFNPSLFLEFARARDLSRPNWYLPCWYGSTASDEFRLEQYLSFQTNIQGMMSPPEIDPWQPDKVKAAQGVVESNHLMARLGTIFTTMPVTRPPVAVLFSLSQMIHEQTKDRKINYAHDTMHGRKVVFPYLAGKLLQHQFMPVLDEDVRDGTLAANHKALILTSINYLDPEVVQGIEAFIKQGGLVLLTADCQLKIDGAVTLKVTPRFPQQDKIQELMAAKKYQEVAPLTTLREHLKGAQPLVDALRPHLKKANIKPPLTSDEPGIVVTRQAAGDVEYLFAVNAAHDPQGDARVAIKAVTAKLGFADDNRPIYDAMHGDQDVAAPSSGKYRFGPGQMRVFARTTRPIAGVKVATPLLHRDYTSKEAPLRLDLSIAVLHDKGLLSGSVPLRIRVLDPLGAVRYDLHRATDRGVCQLSLPLAINDPAGKWTVEAAELLKNTRGDATFTLPAVPTCNLAAGATRRAVHLADDRDRIFRFFRTHASVTLVTGKGDYDAAAQRIVRSLDPWNVKCTIMTAEEANKPRPITPEEAPTFIGLDYAGRGQIKPGDKNNPRLVGFAVRGPVILLGTPEDNPLIKYLLDAKFLPFTPSKPDMPGPGRGYVAWQRDAIGNNQESIALIGYDAEGIGEAVGSMYEMLAGMEPLTRYVMPKRGSSKAANKSLTPPQPTMVLWDVMPDRIVGLSASADELVALSHDGTELFSRLRKDRKTMESHKEVLDAAGLRARLKEMRPPATPAEVSATQKKLGPQRLVKLVASDGKRKAVAFWGGTVQILDEEGRVQAMRRLPQDVTALTWFDGRLIAGDADGRLMALTMK
ncbi:MAG TPA: hypothetical protein VMG10_27590 [Gemmataceae bacterium]|nr:hypothetical protein [Gemmataceae bacterium]